MPQTDEDDRLRQEIQALLGAAPSHEQLKATYAGRILVWLATPDMPVSTKPESVSRRRPIKRSPTGLRGA